MDATAPGLARCLRPGMLLLADRGFATAPLVAALAAPGAQLLIRRKNGRRLPALATLADGSFLALLGPTRVRVIDARITATLAGGHRRTGAYRLVTTLTAPTATRMPRSSGSTTDDGKSRPPTWSWRPPSWAAASCERAPRPGSTRRSTPH
ncbi:hypothetical protein F4561_006372 [Lipingzhangella halophila]|uniref:DDE family transposase n=1 Tax=Lipingzhangella halophila TaxID=1783352 RepID=A0A7W7RNW9_9ACTN|nr:hypothetical protein [Lipingzhangella halophila]MBB4935478.1 hypothetical protein [Lipingzhangella halophila]